MIHKPATPLCDTWCQIFNTNTFFNFNLLQFEVLKTSFYNLKINLTIYSGRMGGRDISSPGGKLSMYHPYLSICLGRMGGTLAPWVGKLSMYHPYLPVAIFGINAIIGKFLKYYFANSYSFNLKFINYKCLKFLNKRL